MQKLKISKKAQMTAKVRQDRQTNKTRFLEAPLLRQAEGELKNTNQEVEEVRDKASPSQNGHAVFLNIFVLVALVLMCE